MQQQNQTHVQSMGVCDSLIMTFWLCWTSSGEKESGESQLYCWNVHCLAVVAKCLQCYMRPTPGHKQQNSAAGVLEVCSVVWYTSCGPQRQNCRSKFSAAKQGSIVQLANTAFTKLFLPLKRVWHVRLDSTYPLPGYSVVTYMHLVVFFCSVLQIGCSTLSQQFSGLLTSGFALCQ